LAFYYCTSLTSITIPNSVTSIEVAAFSGCTSLTEIKFNGTVEEWKNVSKGNHWKGDNNWNSIPATQVVCLDGVCGLDD
jgi:hypothetical protein